MDSVSFRLGLLIAVTRQDRIVTTGKRTVPGIASRIHFVDRWRSPAGGFLTEQANGGPPTAIGFAGRSERANDGETAQDCVDAGAESPGSLTVNHPHSEDASLPAGGQILREKVAHLARLEGVQIEFPGDRDLDRLGLKVLPGVQAFVGCHGR